MRGILRPTAYSGTGAVRTGLVLGLLLWSAALPGSRHAHGVQAAAPTPAPEPQRWAILVTGVTGDPELQEEYLGQMRTLAGTLVESMQFARENIFVLFDDPAKDPGLIRYRSTRENLEKAGREIAARAGGEDLVFVFLGGHGSHDQAGYKLNLVGPDPTAEEVAGILYSIPAGRFVVVNATNCSGASMAAFAGRGRIVATATRSGSEKNRTHMGTYFIEGLVNNTADADKNGRVSVFEAFAYAAGAVAEHYTRTGNLQTEHPMLDDNGDGRGHAEPGPDNGDGMLARSTYLDAGDPLLRGGTLTAEERKLAAEAAALEKRVEELRYAKADMPAAEYERKLEELLLKLAEIHEKLRKK